MIGGGAFDDGFVAEGLAEDVLDEFRIERRFFLGEVAFVGAVGPAFEDRLGPEKAAIVRVDRLEGFIFEELGEEEFGVTPPHGVDEEHRGRSLARLGGGFRHGGILHKREVFGNRSGR